MTACVVLVDKPVGPTSFDIVRTARRGLKTRVGHAGTLDPFASGLLLVMIGAATRISQLLMGLPKEYDLTVQFGAVSNTADPTGEITPTEKRTTAAQVMAVLDGFRGRIRQRVPLTSAVKVDGEPLYRKAHRGETAETPEREVMIYDVNLIDFDEEAQTARLLALTGSGVYMRALAEDIGRAVGAVATPLPSDAPVSAPLLWKKRLRPRSWVLNDTSEEMPGFSPWTKPYSSYPFLS